MTVGFNPEAHFSGDPYIEPDNLHVRKDGTVIGHGPHGEEFVLTEQERSIAASIADRQLPGHSEQLAQWHQASQDQESVHPY